MPRDIDVDNVRLSLEDKDWALVSAILELTEAIKEMVVKNGR